MSMRSELTKFIKKTALEVGFDACGIAKAERLDNDALLLQKWIEEGRAGRMKYMSGNFEKRVDPTLLVDGCKSVIALLMNYFPSCKISAKQPHIAKYAVSGVDYHYVLKEKLAQLEQKISAIYGVECFNPTMQHRFVDSAPILERRWAERAGLGWIGKNRMLINPEFGSYTFIGVLLINVELDYDTPMADGCGECVKCIKHCPTKAITLENGMNATKCIAYQTIENRENVDDEIKDKLSGKLFGCDICQDVCPWNRKKGKPHTHEEFAPHPYLKYLYSEDIKEMSSEEFKKYFKNSAFERAGLEKLKQTSKYVFREKKLD